MSLLIPGVADFVGDKIGQGADFIGDLGGKVTGQDKVEEAATKEGQKMDALAAEAKAVAAEQAGNLQLAAAIRGSITEEGYAQAQAQNQPWSNVGDASRQQYEQNILQDPQQFGTEAGTRLQEQALMGQGDIDPRLAQYSQQAIDPSLQQGGYQGIQEQAAIKAGQGVSSGMTGELDTRAMNQQGLSSELMQQASTAPQSQYFDQAAEAAMNRPSRLEDIEGYGLMQQARDEALQASGQQFAGGGKFYSGSRLEEAGNIGAREAQSLIRQDDARRQQQVQNLMGLGSQDVAMTQQGFQNRMGAEGQQFGMGQQQFQNLAGREQANVGLQQQNIQNALTGGRVIGDINQQAFQNQVGVQSMQDQRSQQELQNIMGIQGMQNQMGQQDFQNLGSAAQQGLGVQQMNYGAGQNQLGQMRDLMGFGYGVDQRTGDLAVQEAQQLGQGGYGSAQDQANIIMGGQAQSAGLTQAGSGYNMEGALSRQKMMGDLIGAGATVAGGL